MRRGGALYVFWVHTGHPLHQSREPDGLQRASRILLGEDMNIMVMRPLMAEFIGAFALTFIGAGSIVVNAFTTPPGGHGFTTLVGVALAHGFTIFVMASAFGHVSGAHFNPAVTVAFLVTKRIAGAMGSMYIVAQLMGAGIAGMTLVATMPAEAIAATKLGATLLAPGIGPLPGLILEAVATFFLVSVIFGSAVDPRGAGNLAPLAIGMTVAMDILAIGPLTGASMNPSRSFGPAFALAGAPGIWGDHLIYWIGPILGAIVAAIIYDYIIQGKGREPEVPAIAQVRAISETPSRPSPRRQRGRG